MTDLRKAAEMALKALDGIHVGNMTPMAEENWNKALTALRQALAQGEQEPVAYADPLDLAKDGNWDTFICKHASENHEGSRFKVSLFTAPPSKSEQGCAECGVKASEGYALYCVKCTELFTQPEQTPVAQIYVKNGYWIETRNAETKGLSDGLHSIYTAPVSKQKPVEYDAPALYKAKAEREKEPLCWLKETGSIGGGYEQTAWGDTSGFPVFTAPVDKQVPDSNSYALADKVRTALDRESCPGVFMNIAWEAVVKNYSAPSSKPWQSLTDDQIETIVDLHTSDDAGYDIFCDGRGVARAIEAALRSKNNG